MLPEPKNIQKYLYVEKSPTWLIRGMYLFGIVGWTLVLYSYFFVFNIDPFYLLFVTPIMLFLTVYHYVSFGLNLFYKQMNLSDHKKIVDDFWSKYKEPSVDVFLPICGEDIKVLVNTWKNVKLLNYSNYKVYVLDDSSSLTNEHRVEAEKCGFTYLQRPNRGVMKKAGNLKYGFDISSGDFILILDADFAPHPDFLRETVPYMLDEKVAIIQTPQYFDTSPESYKSSPIAYNAAYTEESFYRFIQVARDRFNGTICCGSNALYRRDSLNKIGGTYQIEHSEDAHTGFALASVGYQIKYLPVILAVGLCPDNYYSFFHQQHRWCSGSMHMMKSKLFWDSKVSWKTKLCYISGFMFYLHNPIVLIFSLQMFWVLFIYNDVIPKSTGFLYAPDLLFGLIYLFIFPIIKVKIGYLGVMVARIYAYTHAVFSAFLKISVGWVSTNSKQSSLSAAYVQTTYLVVWYLLIYLLLMLIGVRTGSFHLFNIKYWSIQFWITYNFLLSAVFLVKLLTTARDIKRRREERTDVTKIEPNISANVAKL